MMDLTNKYKQDAAGLTNFELENERTVIWESPSNIALIKYWGKYGDQLPQNPSLSFTLKKSKTITKVVYQKAKNTQSTIEYVFRNHRNIQFEENIKKYFQRISEFLPFLKKLDFKIYSDNTFPHSAGIASSASSNSALALCLCSIEQDLFSTWSLNETFYRKASFLARLGSGSACRSIPGKVALWGNTGLVKESSNEFAVVMDDQVHETFKTYRDAILIIDSGEKALSSSVGHKLMDDHPFTKARYQQAVENLGHLLVALKNGNEKDFARIVENEAFTLHALMLSSKPSFWLMKPNTLEVISKLIEFRKVHAFNFTFTLDAGPNVHILYPQTIRIEMLDFINRELTQFCENGKWIDDEFSNGPHWIKTG